MQLSMQHTEGRAYVVIMHNCLLQLLGPNLVHNVR